MVLGVFSKFLISQNWVHLLTLLVGIFPCILISMVFSRGSCMMAYGLGDSTPRLNSRDRFHPFLQIDPVGLIFFVTSGIGWGKVLPVKPENFKHPKGDMLLVLLAGMGCVFGVALFSLGLAGILLAMAGTAPIWDYVIWLCLYVTVLSFGFLLSQVLPLPFFGLYQVFYLGMTEEQQGFADKIQGFVVLFLLVLLWVGYLTPILSQLVAICLEPFCVFVPFSMIEFYFLVP